MSGVFWSLTFQEEKGFGVDGPKTTDNLSMPSFGFCAPAHLGGTFRLIMGTGRTPTDAFVVGETKECGRIYWKNWSVIQTLSGS
jgi:hypothetical protein